MLRETNGQELQCTAAMLAGETAAEGPRGGEEHTAHTPPTAEAQHKAVSPPGVSSHSGQFQGSGASRLSTPREKRLTAA